MISTYGWPLTLLLVLVTGGIAQLVYHLTSKSAADAKTRVWLPAAIGAGVGLLLARLMVYYWMPVYAGVLFGYIVPLLFTVVPGTAIGAICSADRDNGFHRRHILAGVALAFLFIVVPVFQYGYNTLGPANAELRVKLPNISTDENGTIPPSDPNRLVQVTKSIAAFKGHSALTKYASQYKLDPESYTLQSVKGHRYWIAPLSLNNSGDTFWSPLFGNYATSPGFVIVDAEDADAEARLDLNHKIALFTDQWWCLKLQRHLYQAGFTDGQLDDPSLEVDDEWNPYWVVTYVKPAFGGVSGSKVDKVILVKMTNNEPEVLTYDPSNATDRANYAWVDRVISKATVERWATDWGMWQGQFARSGTWNHWRVRLGLKADDTMAPADVELCYTTKQENVWVVPMTGTVKGSTSVIGVLVFDTNRNEGTWYPHLSGFNHGKSVKETMKAARDNIRHYDVEHVQLMSIYGELTWVAIYTSKQEVGSSFGGIGFLPAHSQNTAEVVFAGDKGTALARYATLLANRHQGGGNVSRIARQSKEITAKVLRIAALPSATGSPTYQFKVVGDKHTFLLTREVYRDVALVREGDTVTFTYIDTDAAEVPVNAFKCPQLDQ